MWDAFLKRSCESCMDIGTPKNSFAKRRLDINSVEYQSYIHKDVLGYLGKYAMPSKQRTRPNSNKNVQEADASKKQDIKYKPVYFKVEKPREEAAKSHGTKSALLKNTKVDGCVCFKSPKIKQAAVEPEHAIYENVPTKCGYCDIQKKKQTTPKKKATPPSQKAPLKIADKPKESKIKRHPILILRKKCTKPSVASVLYRNSLELATPRKFNFGKWILYKYGEKGSGTRTRGEPQDFYRCRDESLESGTLFEDPEFPATDSSLFFSRRPDRNYEWKRPHEICDNPQFFVEGYSRFDVQQGELGDCWLLAAAANLTLYNRLFLQIVPDDQDFDEKYAGIFHFRFWQYGKWVDVVIDDRLPTYRGQLIFLHSTEENEFWSALLEKAYAKLHGSYEALKGGSTCEAMEDFTGGVTEMYEMEACPPNLFQIMIKAYERASLMGCSIEPDPRVLEAETPEGLVRGHAYSITRVQHVDIQTPNVTGKIPLLRLRNPWGNESEWNGAWSDGSAEWRFISDSEKEELGLTFDNDGEFWMSFKDFQKYFSRVEICNLNPDSLSEEELMEGNKKKWEMSVYEGEWVRGVTAGGCRNFLDSFWRNPQYRITLTEVDEDDDEGNCTLIIGLMQKNRRQIRSTGVDLLTIGFAIYHIPYPDRVPKPLDLQFFKYNASVARSPSFINLREVSCRFKLPPGSYCIVPSTFDPNEEGEFLLRVFSENQNNMEENEQQIGYTELDETSLSMLPSPHIVPRVSVQSEPDVEPPIIKVSSAWAEVAQSEPSPEERQETDKVFEVFLKVAGEDKEVDWRELKEILDFSLSDELTKAGFSKDICRSMIAMMDADRSGKLGYEEFKTLWVSLRNWKNVWTLYDVDKSGALSGFELRDAMQSAGYMLNNRLLGVLMHRYGGKNGEIKFDDFLMCAVKVKTMIDVFKAKDKTDTNVATFSLEEWLENTLYT